MEGDNSDERVTKSGVRTDASVAEVAACFKPFVFFAWNQMEFVYSLLVEQAAQEVASLIPVFQLGLVLIFVMTFPAFFSHFRYKAL